MEKVLVKMPLITDEYREKLRSKINQGGMGISADLHKANIIYTAGKYQANTVLDYGSGPRKWCERFFENSGVQVHSYDPCVEGLEDDPPACDFVACIDVLEHIEPDCLTLVLNHLRRKTGHAVYASISTRPAKKTFPDGTNCHLIVRPAQWWLELFMIRFRIKSFAEGETSCVLVGEPK